MGERLCEAIDDFFIPTHALYSVIVVVMNQLKYTLTPGESS